MEGVYAPLFAELQDLDSWMQLIEIVRDNFPGLETTEQIESYKHTVIKNMNRHTAICVKDGNSVVGILIFFYNAKCLSCMAVHPKHRRKGIASMMIKKMLSLFPRCEKNNCSCGERKFKFKCCIKKT